MNSSDGHKVCDVTDGDLFGVHRCEVRPGPVFLLRSYTFLKDGSFRLVQFHYSDESCIIPRLTLSAKGALLLRGGSWVTPGGTEAEYTLARVTVTPHSTQVSPCHASCVTSRHGKS